MKKSRLLKYLLSLFLIPVILAAFKALITQIKLFTNYTINQNYFYAGALTYLIIQILLFKPLRTYVFGHELTHALWALIFGGRVKEFKVSKDGGRVVLTKTNFLINLAPYFFPVYTFLVVVIYFVLKGYGRDQIYWHYIVFFLGFTLAFHLALLFYAFSLRQADVKKTGRIFSSTLVIFINILMVVLTLKLVSAKDVSLRLFAKESLTNTQYIWHWIIQKVTQIIQVVIQYIWK